MEFKFKVIETFVHELTHYKQLIEGKYRSEEHMLTDSDLDFEAYYNSAKEIEARHKAKRFKIKKFIKILFM